MVAGELVVTVPAVAMDGVLDSPCFLLFIMDHFLCGVFVICYVGSHLYISCFHHADEMRVAHVPPQIQLGEVLMRAGGSEASYRT